jgi:NAD(P)-dependent dehydrogenase (short-subunit alcohol dehydrogenase family)
VDGKGRWNVKLKGKVAIITGGGRGLGRAIALAMAREGARIAIMSRSEGDLKMVLSEIRNSGGEGFLFPGDVSVESDVSNMVREALSRFSTVDILVNNAAVIGPARLLQDADSKSWEETIGINLNGVFLCCHAALPFMVKQQRGKIINVTSGLGQMPFPRFSAYAVTKAGVIQFTRSLSEEFKEDNIQVNAIDPGVMDTDMQRQLRGLGSSILGEKIYRQLLDYKEKGLLKKTARIAPLAVYLASQESDRLTGHNGTLEYYRGLGWKG